MVVCPHCQFENPSQNRFCQRCGNPLKELLAILTPLKQVDVAQPSEAPLSPSPNSAQPAPAKETNAEQPLLNLAKLLTEEQYLDPEKRYQLRKVPSVDAFSFEEIELEVIDCLPAHPSPIQTYIELNTSEEEAVKSYLPPFAFPYWKLQETFFSVVPELQAAWTSHDVAIVLIENRPAWLSLPNVLNSLEIESLELIHWFYEIINLWDDFVSFNLEVSLLTQENLGIDDDQVLCLRRLIANPEGQTFTLKDLGSLWRAILQNLTTQKMLDVEKLALDVENGIITDSVAIRDALATIADRIQEADFGVGPSEGEFDFSAAAEEFSPIADEPSLPLSFTLSEEETPKLGLGNLLPVTELATSDEMADFEAEVGEEGLSELPTMALPMKLYRVDEVGRTHVGRQRSHNEDSFFAETKLQRTDSPSGPTLTAKGLYILCDGMGGHSGGEVASALAVNALRQYFQSHWQAELPDHEIVKDGILQANQAIFERNEADERAGNARMGTTLVMVLLADHQVVVAHVGDSRLYCLTRQGLKQATVDHEVGQREINRGVEPAIAYARPDAYQLTQALGPRSNREVVPNITTLDITQDTLLLLCSDGMSDNDLLETYLESHLQPMLRSQTDLEEGMANLIDLANEHNGHDNITAIAVRIKVRPNLDAAQLAIPTQPFNLEELG